MFKLQAAAAAAKSLQSCPTLCDPVDGSPPGSPVPGILQARTLEWGAISSSNAWKGKVKVNFLSRVRLLVTPWTAAHQAPPSMGFSRQEYRSGMPLPSPSYTLGIHYSPILPLCFSRLEIWSLKDPEGRTHLWSPEPLQLYLLDRLKLPACPFLFTRTPSWTCHVQDIH